MAKLTWDQPQERKAETGVSKAVLYANGGNGVAWNGIISISSSPDGADDNDLYANNILYGRIKSPENYKGSIECYTYPREFEICDGQFAVIPGLNIGQQRRAPFNLCYRTEIFSASSQTAGYKIHLVYNARVSPGEKSYETVNDSPDATTFSWDFTTNPIVVEGYKPFSEIVIDTTEVDWINLEELEKILYGLGDDAPAMPSPDFILNLVMMNQVARKIVDALSLHGHWIWDEFNFEKDTVKSATDRESLRHVVKGDDFEIDFVQPSVFYSLKYADKSTQEYFVTVVDNKTTSELAANLEEQLDLEKDVDPETGIWTIRQDSKGFYYYPYVLTM